MIVPRQLGAFSAAALCAFAAISQAPSEAEVRAAYVLNFLSLTTWPAAVAAGALRLCVPGKIEASDPLMTLEARPASGRVTHVLPRVTPKEAPDCHALLLRSAERARLRAWLAAVEGKPTLVITEFEESARYGGAINLRPESGRIVFDVDRAVLQEQGLALSSHALRLARTIY